MPLPSPSWTHQAMISLRNSHAFTKTAHWVIPGVLLQGQRPEAHEIRKIVTEANCSTFVCLQAECAPEDGSILLDDGGVQDWKKCERTDYDAYGEEVRAITKDIGVSTAPTFLHYGIKDMHIAKSIDGLEHVVTHLAKRIQSGEIIYLHCLGGKGRAGLVASCLLIELYQIDANSALEYIDAFCQLRNVEVEDVQKRSCIYMSPETKEQKEQVKEYHRLVVRRTRTATGK
eukprot:817146_1